MRDEHPATSDQAEELTLPTLRDTLRALWRGLTLRCPRCGGGHILRGWFGLKERCPTCGLRLERGEEEDYYLGGMLLNIILVFVIFAVAFLGALLIMWPDVHWDALEYVLGGAMIILPIALYPVSRVLWLAIDRIIRPRVDRAEE
jgi:uncharacterized protein (DUF983 family)